MLFADVKGDSVTPVRRLYGDNFVVDEVLWHGHNADGRPFLCDGKSGDVSFRLLLHGFDIRDGKIHPREWQHSTGRRDYGLEDRMAHCGHRTLTHGDADRSGLGWA